MIEQVDIRRSEHGGWMVRFVGDDDRTQLAQRVDCLAAALVLIGARLYADLEDFE